MTKTEFENFRAAIASIRDRFQQVGFGEDEPCVSDERDEEITRSAFRIAAACDAAFAAFGDNATIVTDKEGIPA